MDTEPVEKKKRPFRGIHFRCSESDLATIRADAATAGMKLSQYVRDYCLIPRTAPKLPVEIIKATGGFGRNLNQLTHLCQVNKDAPALKAVEALRADVRAITDALFERIR